MKLVFLFTDSEGELLTLKGLLNGTKYHLVLGKNNPGLLNNPTQSNKPDLLIFLEPLNDEEKLLLEKVAEEKYPTLVITKSEEISWYSKLKRKGNVAFINNPFGRLTLISILDLLTKDKLEYLFLKSGQNERIKIALHEIVYLEASLNYCYIKTQAKSTFRKYL